MNRNKWFCYDLKTKTKDREISDEPNCSRCGKGARWAKCSAAAVKWRLLLRHWHFMFFFGTTRQAGTVLPTRLYHGTFAMQKQELFVHRWESWQAAERWIVQNLWMYSSYRAQHFTHLFLPLNFTFPLSMTIHCSVSGWHLEVILESPLYLHLILQLLCLYLLDLKSPCQLLISSITAWVIALTIQSSLIANSTPFSAVSLYCWLRYKPP